jgi:DNA-binding FadR family transcriptional regulator
MEPERHLKRTRETQRLYAVIAQALGAKIAKGEYKVGERLPSERDLAQAHSVSRPTIREAIIALEIDGLVEVRMGSGVYVTHKTPPSGAAGETDAGPFELLEARRIIEGGICGLAATRINQEQLDELAAVLDEMATTVDRDVSLGEDADRRFHMLIAEATDNESLIGSVRALWDARARSPQYRHLSTKAHAAGVVPRMDEHRAILAALTDRDPVAAQAAMQRHLSRVIESLLTATEVEELERARVQVDEQRRRYAVKSP